MGSRFRSDSKDRQGIGTPYSLNFRCSFRILLRAHVKNIGVRPTNSQKIDIAKRRERLLGRIIEFQSQAEIFLDSLDLDMTLAEKVDEDWSDSELVHKSAEELFDLSQENAKLLSRGQVENMTLFLPSSLGEEACIEAEVGSIAKKEKRLRKGQANDALHQLRLAIGQKSFMFRHRLRNARSKTRKTRAWDDINAIGNTVSHHRRVYHSARNALVALGASRATLEKYQIISSADTRSSTVIVDPNPRGQRNTGLPWFWGQETYTVRPVASDDSPIMTECECLPAVRKSCLQSHQFIVYIGSAHTQDMSGGRKNGTLRPMKWVGP